MPDNRMIRRYGFHFSIARGVTAALQSAKDLGATAMQIFPGNPRGWEQKPLDPEDAAEFRRLREEYDIRPVLIHLPYLPNLASPDRTLYRKSVAILKDSLAKAALLGVEFVNTHAGSRRDAERGPAIRRLAAACDEALAATDSADVAILIENSSGGGTELGGQFADLADTLAAVKTKQRIHVCLDTAHAFGAGYDLRTPTAVRKTLGEFDRIVGLSRLKAIHFNDSLVPLASLRDRHQHIGKGEIGKTGLRALFRDRRLEKIPFIMETPQASPEDDRMNLKTVRTFLKGAWP